MHAASFCFSGKKIDGMNITDASNDHDTRLKSIGPRKNAALKIGARTMTERSAGAAPPYGGPPAIDGAGRALVAFGMSPKRRSLEAGC